MNAATGKHVADMLPIDDRTENPPQPASADDTSLATRMAGFRLSSITPFLRYGADRIGLVGVVGISLCFFAAVASLSAVGPLEKQVELQQKELMALQTNNNETNQVAQGDQSQRRARQLVYELPAHNELPKILGQIVEVASDSGLSLDKGSYEFTDTRSSAISLYRLNLPVRGSYPQVRQFIENTLASTPVIALERLRLDRSEVSDEVIAAELEFAVLVGNRK